LYGSLRAVNVLLAGLRSTLHCARCATGLAPNISRAGISLRRTEPGDIENHVQQKMEKFTQA